MTLLQCDLVMDGSADPPGDRLDLAVFLLSDENDFTVQVRPYRVSGEHNEDAKPIKARGKLNRDNSGLCLVTAELKRQRESPLVKSRLVIPYEDLDLPKGVHQIAYEVKLLRGADVVVVKATPLSRVTVSDRLRQELHASPQSKPLAMEKQRVQAVILGERTRGGEPGEVVTKQLEIVPKTSTDIQPPRSVAVKIPGGFDRETVPAPSEGQQRAQQMAARTSEPRVMHFATNRAWQAAKDNQPEQFGNEVGKQVQYGSCVVNFPVHNHKKGNLELPDWWRKGDANDFFLLKSTRVLEKDAFLRGVIGPHDVLVFVHGFSNTFESTVLRLTQLQNDIEFKGKAIAFCWPSLGVSSQDAYKTDATRAADSAPALAEVLRNIIDESTRSDKANQRSQVHIIAHSMGNRILLNALYELGRTKYFKPGNKPLGQVIMAAPDVGAVEFNNKIVYATNFAQQVTYYYCGTDVALDVSRKINKYEPVGMNPLFENDLRTIDANGVSTSFLNHDYFSCSPLVLLDMQLMLNLGWNPDRRIPPLAARSEVFGRAVWAFRAVEVKAVASRR